MGEIVFFAFILFVMGGITAYMGDRLGSYIGKKRHSTFGLRPRHTAMLWTVVSGGVIAVGTLLLFVALNDTFKTALIRGPQLLKSNSELTNRNQTLIRRNQAAAQQAEADGEITRTAQAKAAEAQKTLGSAVSQLNQTKTILAQSRAVLAQRQAALGTAQQQLAAASRGLSSTHAELSDAQAQVRLARAGVQAARRQAQTASSQVVQANKSVLTLVIKQDALHTANAQLNTANARLNTANARLIKQNQVQENLLQASQGHALIFRREEELGRTVIAARQDPAALRRELSVFLDQVELTARQRGAGGLDNAPAIVIPALGEASDNGAAAREAALDAISQNIAAEGGFMPSIVVVADARYNTFRGEAVKLDLRPYANILIFSQGTVIARGTVDGSQPEDVILRQLQAFLADQVRTTALQRGIIPLHDPQSGAPLVGQPISSTDSVSLVKQIQQAGPNASITASAAEDTYSGDLLQLKFHVTGG